MRLPTTPFSWPTTSGSSVLVHFVMDDVVVGVLEGETEANVWNAGTGMPMVPDCDRDAIVDLERRPEADPAGDPFTVVFHIDGDYGVETFVQEVFAHDPSSAYDLGVEKAEEDGGTSSGRTLTSTDWDNASEIGVFVGHGLDAYAKR